MAIKKSRLQGRRKVKAFSLLEILFAFTMFVTVMIPLMSVWVTHARAFNQSQDQEVAGSIAQQLMEQNLNLGYQAINVGGSPLISVQRRLRGVIETSIFNYTVTITSPVGVPMPTVVGPSAGGEVSPTHHIVDVRVGWHDSTGDHIVAMESNAGW